MHVYRFLTAYRRIEMTWLWISYPQQISFARSHLLCHFDEAGVGLAREAEEKTIHPQCTRSFMRVCRFLSAIRRPDSYRDEMT